MTTGFELTSEYIRTCLNFVLESARTNMTFYNSFSKKIYLQSNTSTFIFHK